MRPDPVKTSNVSRVLTTGVENLCYLTWYVVSPLVLAQWLTTTQTGRINDYYTALPEYFQKVSVSFATTTVWAYCRGKGRQVRPDWLFLDFVNNSPHSPEDGTLIWQILMLCVSGGLAGVILRYTELHKYMLKLSSAPVPRYDTVFQSLGPLWDFTKPLGLSTAVQQCMIWEATFSFLSGYLYLVLAQIRPARDVVPGGNLNRWSSSTLVYLGTQVTGYRPCLQIGYTALVAAYYADASMFILSALANTLGLIVAICVFQIERHLWEIRNDSTASKSLTAAKIRASQPLSSSVVNPTYSGDAATTKQQSTELSRQSTGSGVKRRRGRSEALPSSVTGDTVALNKQQDPTASDEAGTSTAKSGGGRDTKKAGNHDADLAPRRSTRLAKTDQSNSRI